MNNLQCPISYSVECQIKISYNHSVITDPRKAYALSVSSEYTVRKSAIPLPRVAHPFYSQRHLVIGVMSYLIRTRTQPMGSLVNKYSRIGGNSPMEPTEPIRMRASLLKSPKVDNSVTPTTTLTFRPETFVYLSQLTPRQHQPRVSTRPVSTSLMELIYTTPPSRAMKLKIAPLRGEQQSCPPVVNGGRQMRRIDSECNSSPSPERTISLIILTRNHLRRMGPTRLRQPTRLHRAQNHSPK